MLLLELFAQTYPWHHDSTILRGAVYPTWTAEFSTEDGREYEMTIAQDASDDPGEVVAGFTLLDSDIGTMSLSGTGDAFRVMGTVRQITQAYAEAVKPKRVTFSASSAEPSRVKLYRRMITGIPGYDVSETVTGRSVTFTLRQKDASL